MGGAVLLGMVSASHAAPLFGRSGTYEVDGAPIGVGALQRDGEQGLDIATANGTGAEGPSFSLLVNRGGGSFFPETRTSVGNFSLQHMTAGDFDEDGLGDLALAADIIDFPPRGVVLIYRNLGGGSFAEPLQYRLPGFFPTCLETGDVDGDDILDLVACHSTSDGDGRVTVLLATPENGEANGTFRVAFSEAVGIQPSSAAIGRIDTDDEVDIAFGDPVDSSVGALFGEPDGLAPAVPVGDVQAVSSVAIIPQPSGRAAIAATSSTRSRLRIFEQPAPRQFQFLEEHQVFLAPAAMIARDFDLDGDRDIAIASPLGTELWLGIAGGRFEEGEVIAPARFGLSSTIDLTSADFNGDQRPDVATSAAEEDLVTVVLNGADVPFTPTNTPTITDTPTITPTPTTTDTPTFTLTPTITRTPTPTNPDPTDTPTPIVTTTPAGPGDANCDGRIDAADVDGLARRLYAPGCEAADVDGDGTVTAADLVALILLLAE